MPTIFVADETVFGVAADDGNDGLDAVGLPDILNSPTYTAATRTLYDNSFVNAAGVLRPGCTVGITGGTGWTAGLYELESVDSVLGTITFKAAAGVNVSTNDVPTFATGPKATLAAALALVPGTPVAPWTSHAANAAVRIAFYTTTGGFDLLATWQWASYATAAFHHKICGAFAGGRFPSQTDAPPMTLKPGLSLPVGSTTATYPSGANPTITANENVFTPSMVGQGIVFTTGASGSWLITSYISPTQVVVSGTVGSNGATPSTFSVGYHTGTPLFQLVTGSSAYYLDIEGITFNGASNGRTASYCLDLATANGDVTISNCRATASSNSGIRILSRRCHLASTLVYAAGSHGFELTSTALNDLRVVGCEAYSNTNDGFNISGTSEGTALIECVAHNNSRHGFQFAGSNRSTLVARCVAAANAQHGFDMSSGVDLHVIGCVSTNNGTTSSHRQFSFGTTTSGTRAIILRGNAAFAAGSTVATDATDTATSQIASLSSSPLRSTAIGSFDGRLSTAFRNTLSTYIPGLYGLGAIQTTPPGLVSSGGSSGSSGDQRVLLRP